MKKPDTGDWRKDEELLDAALTAGLVMGFRGGHGRDGIISVIDGTCDVCLNPARVIAIDASEGEYNPGAICQMCAEKAFKK